MKKENNPVRRRRKPIGEKRNKRGPILTALLLIMACAATFGGFTVARYVLNQTGKSGLVSAEEFYFTSDFLKDTSDIPMYFIDPNQGSFVIKLYNYADSKRVTSENIEYTVAVENGTAAVNTGGSGNSYTLAGTAPGVAELTISPSQSNNAASVKVTVSSSKPYVKTLHAQFTMAFGNQYTVEDESGNTAAVLIMTCTDDGKGISLKLPEGVIPDATDSRVKKKDNSSHEYIFTSPGKGIYSLVLLKKNAGTILEASVTDFADTINLTGK